MEKIYIKIPCVDIFENEDGDVIYVNTFFIAGLTKDVVYVKTTAYEYTNYSEIKIGKNISANEYDELDFWVENENVDEVMTMIYEALNKLELSEKSETEEQRLIS